MNVIDRSYLKRDALLHDDDCLNGVTSQVADVPVVHWLLVGRTLIGFNLHLVVSVSRFFPGDPRSSVFFLPSPNNMPLPHEFIVIALTFSILCTREFILKNPQSPSISTFLFLAVASPVFGEILERAFFPENFY